MKKLETNFSTLSPEAQHFLFLNICKLDVACTDISRITNKLPETVRESTLSLITNNLDRDDRILILELQMIASINQLNSYCFDKLNVLSRQSALALINSTVFAISELWALSNAGVSREVIEQIVNQEAKSLISNSTSEEIAAYFQCIDNDDLQDDVQITVINLSGSHIDDEILVFADDLDQSELDDRILTLISENQ